MTTHIFSPSGIIFTNNISRITVLVLNLQLIDIFSDQIFPDSTVTFPWLKNFSFPAILVGTLSSYIEGDSSDQYGIHKHATFKFCMYSFQILNFSKNGITLHGIKCFIIAHPILDHVLLHRCQANTTRLLLLLVHHPPLCSFLGCLPRIVKYPYWTVRIFLFLLPKLFLFSRCIFSRMN